MFIFFKYKLEYMPLAMVSKWNLLQKLYFLIFVNFQLCRNSGFGPGTCISCAPTVWDTQGQVFDPPAAPPSKWKSSAPPPPGMLISISSLVNQFRNIVIQFHFISFHLFPLKAYKNKVEHKFKICKVNSGGITESTIEACWKWSLLKI